jgi:hypothetical protein
MHFGIKLDTLREATREEVAELCRMNDLLKREQLLNFNKLKNESYIIFVFSILLIN